MLLTGFQDVSKSGESSSVDLLCSLQIQVLGNADVSFGLALTLRFNTFHILFIFVWNDPSMPLYRSKEKHQNECDGPKSRRHSLICRCK